MAMSRKSRETPRRPCASLADTTTTPQSCREAAGKVRGSGWPVSSWQSGRGHAVNQVFGAEACGVTLPRAEVPGRGQRTIVDERPSDFGSLAGQWPPRDARPSPRQPVRDVTGVGDGFEGHRAWTAIRHAQRELARLALAAGKVNDPLRAGSESITAALHGQRALQGEKTPNRPIEPRLPRQRPLERPRRAPT